jgi:hypothetical protein
VSGPTYVAEVEQLESHSAGLVASTGADPERFIGALVCPIDWYTDRHDHESDYEVPPAGTTHFVEMTFALAGEGVVFYRAFI